MEAKSNKKNQVVVTMSSGEAQRIAQICDRLDGTGQFVADAYMFSCLVKNLGIETNLPCCISGQLYIG